MSNSNTRRRKQKKRLRGKQATHRFAGLTYSGVRGPGKSTLMRFYSELYSLNPEYPPKMKDLLKL